KIKSIIAMAEERVLLPTSVKPTHYRVHLTPDLKQFTFLGEVSVDVEVKEATKNIVLHCLDIKVEISQNFHSERKIYRWNLSFSNLEMENLERRISLARSNWKQPLSSSIPKFL